MSNEEKILGILEQMQARMDSMESKMDSMESRMDSMESKMDAMAEKLEEVDQRSLRTQVLLETEVHDKIQLLFDGQSALTERVDRIEENMATKDDLKALEDKLDATVFTLRLTQEDVAKLKKAE